MAKEKEPAPPEDQVKKLEIREKIKSDTKQIEVARGYEDKLQAYGRQLIASIYMLIRNVRLYDPENEIFTKPLLQLRDLVNNIIAVDGRLLLQGAGKTFYLNNMLLKFDSRSFDNVRQLSEDLEKKDVGGFELDKPATVQELQNFIFLFKGEGREKIDELDAASRKLVSLKVAHFAKVREILKGKGGPAAAGQSRPAKLDRKRYSMLLYARIVQFLRKYIAGLQGKGPAVPRTNAFQLVQDMVDVLQDKNRNFIGLTTATDPLDAYCFHAASVAMISVVFGSVLKLRRDQLRNLGMAALFHDIGRVTSKGLLPEGPTDDATKRRHVQHLSIKRQLASAPLNKTTIHSILAAYDSHVDYGTSGRGPHQLDLSLFGKIIQLADCFDMLCTNETTDTAVIMELMSTTLKQKFDPFLLKMFAQSMAIWTAQSADGQSLNLF